MHVLITGGAGFIGSHLGCRLLQRGDRITVLDSLDERYEPAIKRANVEQMIRMGSVHWIEGDVRVRSDVRRALNDHPDVVVHLAARAGVRESVRMPAMYQSVNVDGTAMLLRGCDESGVGQVILASSSSVYGTRELGPFHESDPPAPVSPYAQSKLDAEFLLRDWAARGTRSAACLRLFTVYGPGQPPTMAISTFRRCLVAGTPIPLFGDGSSARDYTFIDDVVDGILAAIARPRSFSIWNLGAGHPISLVDLIRTLERVLQCSATVSVQPAQLGDVPHTWADIQRAAVDLGWRPKVSLMQGLSRWFGS